MKNRHSGFLCYTLRLLALLLLIIVCIPGFSQDKSRGTEINALSPWQNTTVRALVIGISKYSELGPEWQLDYADRDAQLFYDFLLSQPDLIRPENIVYLTNEQATGSNEIITAFTSLLKESKPGDLVIFFFAGHGDVQKVLGSDDGFLLLNKVKKEDYYLSDALEIEEIRKLVMRAGEHLQVNTLLIFDACHSGEVTKDNSSSAKVLSSLTEQWSTSWKIVSCEPQQLSFEDSRWGGGHGVFSWFLINGAKGLCDEDGNGNVTFIELHDYVKDSVRKQTNKAQTPTAVGPSDQVFFVVNQTLKSQALSDLQNNGRVYAENAKPKSHRGLDGSSASQYFFKTNSDEKFKITKMGELLKEGHILPQFSDKSEEKPVLRDFNIRQTETYNAHGINALCVAQSMADDVMATGGEDGKIHIWQKGASAPFKTLEQKGVTCMLYARNDAYLVTGGWGREVWVWSANDYQLLHKLTGHNAQIRAITQDYSGQYVFSAGDDQMVRMWDVETGKLLKVFAKRHTGNITSLCAGENNNELVSAGADGKIIIWDVSKGDVIRSASTGKALSVVRYLEGSHQIVTGSENGDAAIYDAATLKVVERINTGLTNINAITTVYDGDYLILGGKLWRLVVYDNLNQHKVIFNMPISRGVTDMLFSPFNNKLAITYYGGAWSWSDVEIPTTATVNSAYGILQELLLVKRLEPIRERLISYFVAGILTKSHDVIMRFVSNAVNQPDNGQVEVCMAELDKAEELSKGDEIIVEKINLYRNLLKIFQTTICGDFDKLPEAIEMTKKLIEKEPDASYTHSILASIYQKLRLLNEAKAAIGVAAKNIPDWVDPKLSLSYTYFLERQYDSALSINARVIAMAPDYGKAYIQKADLHSFLGGYAAAEIMYKKALTLEPDNPAFLCRYVRHLLKTGEINMAESMIQKARLQDTAYYETYLLEAEKLLFEYTTAVNKKTKMTEKLIWRARDLFDKALELGSGNVSVKLSLAGYYCVLLENPEFIENGILPGYDKKITVKIKTRKLLREVIKADPFAFKAYYLLLNLYSDADDINDFNEVMNNLTTYGNKYPEANYFLAKYFLAGEKKAKGKKYLKLALKMDPNNACFQLLMQEITGTIYSYNGRALNSYLFFYE